MRGNDDITRKAEADNDDNDHKEEERSIIGNLDGPTKVEVTKDRQFDQTQTQSTPLRGSKTKWRLVREDYGPDLFNSISIKETA